MTTVGDTWAPPGYAGRIGVARRDITPPTGIHARMWGAADWDVPSGVHRPLTLSALAVGDGLIVSADLGAWRRPVDEAALREAVRTATGLDVSAVLLHLAHTHAGPSLCPDDAELPGGELVAGYLEDVTAAAVSAAQEARASAVPASLQWGSSECAVATCRDMLVDGRPIVGFAPDEPADGTVLVGRVADLEDGRVLATLVNYACHGTALGWEAALLSPDYVGALREVVEGATDAPCVFLQGASGDQAPREQYTTVAATDRQGAAIGHAALAALGVLPAPGRALAFDGVVESGAPLGMWAVEPARLDATVALEATHVALPMRPRPTVDELAAGWADLDERTRASRVRRATWRHLQFGDGMSMDYPVWLWRLGDTLLVAIPGEAYAWFQQELRRRHPDRAVVVMNLTNGPGWTYLPRRDSYGLERYAVWHSPFAAGALETLLDAVDRGLAAMVR